MKRNHIIKLFTLNLIALLAAVSIQAQWTDRPFRVSETQVRNLVRRIETNTDAFKQHMDSSLDRSRWNNTNNEDNINAFISDFEAATDRLRDSIGSRTAYNNEANDVLMRATYIDQFMTRNRLDARAQNIWRVIRIDLNTLANYYTVSNWNWRQTLPPYTAGVDPKQWTTNRPYRVSETQVRNLVRRIETNTDAFKQHMNRSLDRSGWNNTNNEDNINAFISDFEADTDRLRDSIGSRTAYNNEANDVLMRATYIDRFMTRNRLNARAQNMWRVIRLDLNTLANYYTVSNWNWNQTLPPYTAGVDPNDRFPDTVIRPGGGMRRGLDNRLTGTYRLNTGLSDNVNDVVSRSVNVYSTTDRPNFSQNLERRLSSPETIVIEKVGREVTLASSNAPQVTFTADNTARAETNDRGRTIRTTVSQTGQAVTVNYQGDRNNDFFVTFMPIGNNQLRVTRRIYLPNRNQTITVSSVYDKIDPVARWSDVNVGPTYGGGINAGGVNNTFLIPNGARLTAVLRNSVNTRDTQIGDRFALEVTSPGQYRGAIIEGRVANLTRSGRITGRSNVSLDFDTIRMADGRSYRFEGIVDSVRTASGDTVSVNNEGVIRDSNQTTRTVTRAGIGAALGAIIGAIAGGGSGAAIGAGVGAGAGAGTVLIQGRDNMDLGAGTEFMITSTGPNNVGFNR